MVVRLTRLQAGSYTAMVTVKGTGGDPFEIRIGGPDPHYPQPPGYRWVVESESDTEQFFGTLKQAREYVNRFFDPAPTKRGVHI